MAPSPVPTAGLDQVQKKMMAGDPLSEAIDSPAEPDQARQELGASARPAASAPAGTTGGRMRAARETDAAYDGIAPKGNMWGTAIGDATGSGGLGVSGIGTKAQGPAKPKAKPAVTEDSRRPDARPVEMFRSQRIALLPCSDSARRPLSERMILWARRLQSARGIQDLIGTYERAYATCEISDWRAEAALLFLIQARVKTPGEAEQLLVYFAWAPEKAKFVGQAILRRAVDAELAAAVHRVLFGSRVQWADVDNKLAELPTAELRLAKLREILVVAPEDPQGQLRLVRLLADLGQRDEAIAVGRRLRDSGFMSPALALTLGDVLARAGAADDALRTYSEIVEFDPEGSSSRRLLGDVLLRNGWYDAAYKQYETLTELAAQDPIAKLRLAVAAAGAGRVDEALRLERQIASAEGTPGPTDPRRFARLLSALQMARLLEAKTPGVADGSARDSLVRKMKELDLFSGPGVLVLLTWNDYASALGLDVVREGPPAKLQAVPMIAESSAVGIAATIVGKSEAAERTWRARALIDAPMRDVKVTLYTVDFDGKDFTIAHRDATLAARTLEAKL